MCCPYRCWSFMHSPFMGNPFFNDPLHKHPVFMRQTTPPLKVKSKDMSEKKSYFDADLRIPVFYDSISGKPVSYINSSVENDIVEFKNQIEESAKNDVLKLQQEGKTVQPYRASNVYQVTYNKNGILSMTLLYNILMSGLNNYVKTSYNYDLQTGNPMAIGDLFKPGTDYIQILNNEVRRELTTNSQNYQPSAASKFKGIVRDQPFYLQDNTLVIFFSFNEVAPVSADIPVIRIPLSRLSGVLKPRILR